jgi:hypothetical protein
MPELRTKHQKHMWHDEIGLYAHIILANLVSTINTIGKVHAIPYRER